MTQQSNKSALYILMFSLFITMGGIGIIIPVMPDYLRLFGVGGQALGFLIAGFALAQFLFSPVAGELSDRHGRKLFIVFGLFIYGLSQIFFGLATEVWMLFAARFISGFGAAFIMAPTMAFVADITTLEERGKGMGLLGAAMSLGFTIGPGIGGFLANVNLHFPFYVAGCFALATSLISYFVLPSITPQASPQIKKERLYTQLIKSVKVPYFVVLIVIFTFSFGIANFQATMSIYLNYKFAYTPPHIAIILTVGGFAGVILQVFVIDKLFKRFGEMKVILTNLFVAAIMMFLMMYVSGFYVILLVATLFSIATTFIRPAVNTLVSKLAGDEQGYAAGMNNAYMSLGNMVGPALAGTLFDWNMNVPYLFGTMILLLCLLLAFTWTMRKAPTLMQPSK